MERRVTSTAPTSHVVDIEPSPSSGLPPPSAPLLPPPSAPPLHEALPAALALLQAWFYFYQLFRKVRRSSEPASTTAPPLQHSSLSSAVATETSLPLLARAHAGHYWRLPNIGSSPTPPSATVRDSPNCLTSSLATIPEHTTTKEDQTWNKRQIGYIFDLGSALVLVFLIRPLLPPVCDRWVLAVFAAVWGVGSFSLPIGLFGTSRCEKNWSRHVGRFISLCFSVFVVYCIYILMLHVDGIGAPATLSLSPGADGHVPINDGGVWIWKFVFIAIGVIVLAGHLHTWIRGCYTGGDRDIEPHDGLHLTP